MTVTQSKDAFSGYHPIINFLYFALVLLFTIFLMHPVSLLCSLGAAVLYAFRLNGRAAGRSLPVLLPMLLLAAVANPAFNHEGATILCYLPTGNPLTLESILYGLDGVEGIWGGEDIPSGFPRALLTGYHLTFFPDWLDFYRGDRAALERKYGSPDPARAFYGGTGAETLLDRHPYDLLGGEQQRAALAKTLLLDPEILLLDEPTKGLDAEFKLVFAEILQVLLRRGVTILMVSHDVEFCARYAHRCALFFDGSIVTEAAPRAFFSGNSFYTTSANRMARAAARSGHARGRDRGLRRGAA